MELFAAAEEDRQRIFQRDLASGQDSVFAVLEVAISDWSPPAGRIASGKPLRSSGGLKESLEKSLFDQPLVDELFLNDGFEQFKRYAVSVEMLRLALLRHFALVEGEEHHA